MWKKGEKVFRLYGSNHWGRTGAMMPGDVGTLSEDQKYPGIVHLKEFPDNMGHDVMRIRRVKDYKGFEPKELAELYRIIDGVGFEQVIAFMKKKLRKRK